MSDPKMVKRATALAPTVSGSPSLTEMPLIRGYAVKWDSRNSFGEVFVPGAFDQSLATKNATKPLVMRSLHREPIGKWSEFGIDELGQVVAGTPSNTESAREAVELVDDGVVTGLSVGFWPVRFQAVEPGETVEVETAIGTRSYEFDEWTVLIREAELLEVSLVDIPSDDDARITEIQRERELLLTRARDGRNPWAKDSTTTPRKEARVSDTSSASTEALEQLATAVKSLTDAVGEQRQESAEHRQMIERIAQDVEERQRVVDAERAERESYEPTDADEQRATLAVLGDNVQTRMAALRNTQPELISRSTGLPSEQVEEFQRRCDDAALLAFIVDKPVSELDYYGREVVPLMRAMDTQTAGEGQEWVPTDLSGLFIQRLNLPLRVAAVFNEITMPTNPFEIPGFPVARTRTGTHAEQTADTGQDKFKLLTPASRKITLTTFKFAARALVSREAEEDAILAILPWLQSELRDYVAADIEDAILNGDTTGTHMDSDTTDADDPRKAHDGLRDIALNGLTGATTSAAGGALDLADLRANRGTMGKYGINPERLVHIVSMAGYLDLLGDAAFQTLDKYGSGFTAMSGELGRADGSPVIVSEYQRQNLNASGVYDGVTTNLTVATTVHRDGYIRGVKREVRTEVLRELYAESDQDAVILSTRRAFAARFPTTENVVAMTYNLST